MGGTAMLSVTLLLPGWGFQGAPRKYDASEVGNLVEIAQTEKEAEGRRARAVRELENTSIRTHLPALRRLLREERSLDIRLSAACTLAALGDKEAPRDLLLASAYEGTTTPNCTRSDVILALARLQDPAAELHLEKALKEPAPENDSEFHANVCRALATMGTPGSLALLFGALRSGSPEVRYAAITPLAGLALQPGSQSRDAIRAALATSAREERDAKVGEQAASALFWGGVDGAAFYRILEGDPSSIARARAARVMDRHYLSPARLERLRAALTHEQNATVRAEIEKTLASQERKPKNPA
jgi:hypothetical protein